MTEQPRYTALIRTLIFVFRDDTLLMMKYSGKGTHQTKEKADRKDIYNPIGGHVEEGEDIVQNAVKEAREEAGITLLHPKIKGVINSSGFAGKNIVNFIIVGETNDEVLEATLEGELYWVPLREVSTLNVFADVRPILDKLQTLAPDQMLVGTSRFDGLKLLELRMDVA